MINIVLQAPRVLLLNDHCCTAGSSCTAAGWGLLSERGTEAEELKEVPNKDISYLLNFI